MKKCLTLFCAILLLLNIPSLASAYDEASSMVKISGEYGMSFGLETDEFIWKNANGDYQEHNWRYIDPDLNVNTYDPRCNPEVLYDEISGCRVTDTDLSRRIHFFNHDNYTQFRQAVQANPATFIFGLNCQIPLWR